MSDDHDFTWRLDSVRRERGVRQREVKRRRMNNLGTRPCELACGQAVDLASSRGAVHRIAFFSTGAKSPLTASGAKATWRP